MYCATGLNRAFKCATICCISFEVVPFSGKNPLRRTSSRYQQRTMSTTLTTSKVCISCSVLCIAIHHACGSNKNVCSRCCYLNSKRPRNLPLPFAEQNTSSGVERRSSTFVCYPNFSIGCNNRCVCCITAPSRPRCIQHTTLGGSTCATCKQTEYRKKKQSY